ncbi:hypothetical protein AAG906_013712 [Vitis piasezkii]
MKEGFEKCDYEHTLFIKTSKEGKVLIVSLYVDDLIFTRNDELMFTEFKNSMKHEFDMMDLGKMRYFLGLEVLQRSNGVLSPKEVCFGGVKRFGMDKSNFVHNPIVPAAKRVLRYLKGTTEFGILYKKGGDDELAAYTDSDYAGDLEDKRVLQASLLLPPCACQARWLKRVLGKLSQNQGKSTTIRCDNSSAIKLSKNPVMHGRSKHIDVRWYTRTVELVHCGTQEQLADVMTKPLKLDVFLNLRGLLGVCSEMDIN